MMFSCLSEVFAGLSAKIGCFPSLGWGCISARTILGRNGRSELLSYHGERYLLPESPALLCFGGFQIWIFEFWLGLSSPSCQLRLFHFSHVTTLQLTFRSEKGFAMLLGEQPQMNLYDIPWSPSRSLKKSWQCHEYKAFLWPSTQTPPSRIKFIPRSGCAQMHRCPHWKMVSHYGPTFPLSNVAIYCVNDVYFQV